MSLRQTITNHKMPDELGSIETTFSVAEQYHRQKLHELSEQYYLLTLQKIRILRSSLVNNQKNMLASLPPDAGNTVHHGSTVTFSNMSTARRQTSAPSSPTSSSQTGTQPIPPAAETDDDAEDISDDASDEVKSRFIVGSHGVYTVQKGDTVRLVAAKLGVSRQNLIESNLISIKSNLKPGQQLKYNNRRIVPYHLKNGIVINIPDRTLYYFKSGSLVRHIPVALGVPVKNKKFDWRTPTGKFRIVSKQKDPTWYVPPSIQEEMQDEGREVITSIPPGPSNPLGRYAFKTSLPGIMIHSTTKPWSIYSYASHGCIRVYPQQMESFFREVKVNTPGEIIYRPVKLAAIEDGRIFLEVHRDVYGKGIALSRQAQSLIDRQQLSERVDWKKVRQVIKTRSGVAEDISLQRHVSADKAQLSR